VPTLNQLRYLVALSDVLHFRRAAEHCGVTQPTLSHQIKELEQDLGVQLFERGRRSQVLLTPIAREIVEHARLALRAVRDIEDLGRHGRQWFDETVKIGALPTIGPYLLPRLLPKLHSEYPNLKLYVREGMPAALLDSLASGETDVLLFALPVAASDFSHASLLREELWVVMPQDHPLAPKTKIERSDLADQTILSLEPGHHLYEQTLEVCNDIGAELSHDFEGTSLDTLRLMIGTGLGISLMPTLYVLSEVAKDPLVVARALRVRPPSRTVGLVWRRHSARTTEYEELAGQLRKIIRSTLPQVLTLG
jgi:LysR family hydrogen peroxide-inducible transcriptional activator